MQTSDWEDSDGLEPVESGGQRPLAKTASGAAGGDHARILELRRRLEERLDSKRIEMEYGYDYLDDEPIQ